MSAARLRVAITTGDPCGIGPEVILGALRRARLPADLLIIGDLRVFEQAARRRRWPLPRWQVTSAAAGPQPPAPLRFLDMRQHPPARPGRPTAADGAASLAYLDAAVRLFRQGEIHALVTGPVTKWAVLRARRSFVGQTEYLAEALRVREVVMCFVAERLRVALLTRHLPLRRVPRAVTPALVRMTARLTARALTQQFGIARPRLALCGVNPHAGEGNQGSEERRRLVPALRALRREGIRCEGPFAADGFFARLPGRDGEFDAILCAYHDQGLIPFKLLAGGRGCQMSIGLPLIRTSPDHGSALDIAGRGIASPVSMRYALALAIRLASSSPYA